MTQAANALMTESKIQPFLQKVGEIFDNALDLKSFSISHNEGWTSDESVMFIEHIMVEGKATPTEDRRIEIHELITDKLEAVARDIYFENGHTIDVVAKDYRIDDPCILPYSSWARALAAKALLEGVANNCGGRLKP